MTMNWWQLKVRVHQTWHFTLLCSGVVLGLGLSAALGPGAFSSIAWLLVGLVGFALAYWRRFRWLLVVAFIAGVSIGLWRGSIDQVSRQQYKPLYGKQVTLTGTVGEDVDVDRKGQTIVRLKDVNYDGHQLTGVVWVTIDQPNSIQRSDKLSVSGELKPGFGSFTASLYRADINNIWRPQPGDVALAVREDFGSKVRSGIDEPAASLGMGYLTGQRRSLPADLDESLRVAGLTHIVVASGYNLTILVRMMKRLFEKQSRYLTVFLSGLLIVSFIAVTGLSPSMTRAGLIAGLALGAWYVGRKFHPVTLLVFAAALTGVIEPSYVWGNLGWQLSFAAFAGVMVMAPLMQNYFFGDSKPGTLRQILGETVTAQIMTAPLLLYSFGQISNVAVIANLLVLPLVPLAMLLTWIVGLVGYVASGLVEAASLPAQWLLDYMVTVAKTTANLSWAQTEYELSIIGLGAAYLVIALGCWWMKRSTGYQLRCNNIID